MQDTDDSSLAMFIAFGSLIGVSLGLIFGIALDNLALGVALGPSLGVGFSAALWTATQADDDDDEESADPEEDQQSSQSH